MFPSKTILLELCAPTVAAAVEAQRAGADRIELCTNLAEDGTTPPCEDIIAARNALTIKLHVLIRPRGGNFVYTDEEFETAKSSVHFCGQTGCDGVAIGILNGNNTVDVKRSGKLVAIARRYGMSVTFHRAFDCCADLAGALDDVVATGCDRILTSGGKRSAPEGADVLKNLIARAANRIIILPAAGITPQNAARLIQQTGATEIHGTFRDKKTGRSTLNDLFFKKYENN
jgi:copper homeostasis protein